MILEGQRILVTGGTGSLGKVLVRRLLGAEVGQPEKVVVLSRDEAKQHEMRLEFLDLRQSTDEIIYENFRRVLEFRIGDVRRYEDVVATMRGCSIVINAAALKQVPTCEYFPEQALMTNCVGAHNIVRAAAECAASLRTVVGISTDKACKPVNVMGMTKAIQERIFVAGNLAAADVRMICVRYGNVLASRGSVIPLFHRQIANGGPVTVTDPGMTRFLLSIDRAVDTVFAALRDAGRGEIYLPRVPSAQVMNIARALVGDSEVPIEVTGVRPGEKMHEVMISEEECRHAVRRGEYHAILPMLPELRGHEASAEPTLDAEYSSADEVMDLDDTRELLAKSGLMPGGRGIAGSSELLA